MSNETDFVIVCMNWGDKNSPKPNKKMIECDVYQVKELPKKYKNKKYSQNAVAENFR